MTAPMTPLTADIAETDAAGIVAWAHREFGSGLVLTGPRQNQREQPMERDGRIKIRTELGHDIDDAQLLAGSLEQLFVVVTMGGTGYQQHELRGKQRDECVDGREVTCSDRLRTIGAERKNAIHLVVGHDGDARGGVQPCRKRATTCRHIGTGVACLWALGGDAGLDHLVVPGDAPGAATDHMDHALAGGEVGPVTQPYLVERHHRAQRHKHLRDARFERLRGAQCLGTGGNDTQMRLCKWCSG